MNQLSSQLRSMNLDDMSEEDRIYQLFGRKSGTFVKGLVLRGGTVDMDSLDKWGRKDKAFHTMIREYGMSENSENNVKENPGILIQFVIGTMKCLTRLVETYCMSGYEMPLVNDVLYENLYVILGAISICRWVGSSFSFTTLRNNDDLTQFLLSLRKALSSENQKIMNKINTYIAYYVRYKGNLSPADTNASGNVGEVYDDWNTSLMGLFVNDNRLPNFIWTSESMSQIETQVTTMQDNLTGLLNALLAPLPPVYQQQAVDSTYNITYLYTTSQPYYSSSDWTVIAYNNACTPYYKYSGYVDPDNAVNKLAINASVTIPWNNGYLSLSDPIKTGPAVIKADSNDQYTIMVNGSPLTFGGPYGTGEEGKASGGVFGFMVGPDDSMTTSTYSEDDSYQGFGISRESAKPKMVQTTNFTVDIEIPTIIASSNFSVYWIKLKADRTNNLASSWTAYSNRVMATRTSSATETNGQIAGYGSTLCYNRFRASFDIQSEDNERRAVLFVIVCDNISTNQTFLQPIVNVKARRYLIPNSFYFNTQSCIKVWNGVSYAYASSTTPSYPLIADFSTCTDNPISGTAYVVCAMWQDKFRSGIANLAKVLTDYGIKIREPYDIRNICSQLKSLDSGMTSVSFNLLGFIKQMEGGSVLLQSKSSYN